MVTTQLRGRPERVRTDDFSVSRTELVKFAYSRSQRMTSRTYGRSGVEQNLVGASGEYATLQWMDAQGFDPEPLFEGRSDNGDIRTASGMMVEVKTSRPDWWMREGAVVTAGQLRTISRYNVLVWCVTGPKQPSNATYLMGWVSIAELFARAAPIVVGGRPAVQISVLDSMSEIRLWEQKHREQFRWTLSPPIFGCERSKAHSGPLRRCLQCWWEDLGGPPNVLVAAGVYHRGWCADLAPHHREVMASDAVLQANPCVCVTYWLEKPSVLLKRPQRITDPESRAE